MYKIRAELKWLTIEVENACKDLLSIVLSPNFALAGFKTSKHTNTAYDIKSMCLLHIQISSSKPFSLMMFFANFVQLCISFTRFYSLLFLSFCIMINIYLSYRSLFSFLKPALTLMLVMTQLSMNRSSHLSVDSLSVSFLKRVRNGGQFLFSLLYVPLKEICPLEIEDMSAGLPG